MNEKYIRAMKRARYAAYNAAISALLRGDKQKELEHVSLARKLDQILRSRGVTNMMLEEEQ